jgi:tetratricopeptide (TPR) repeat protein
VASVPSAVCIAGGDANVFFRSTHPGVTGPCSTAWFGLLGVILAMAGGCKLVSNGQNADGVHQFQQGQYQAAIERFHKAIASDPKNPDGYYNLASTYHRLGKLNHRKEDLDQAESYYNQCLDRNENHQECYRALAVLLVEEQRSEEAFRLLEGWANRNPTASPPKVELARLSQEFGKRDAAREYLQEALAVNPYDARALAAMGQWHEQSGNQAQALANYQRSLGHDSFQPELAARVASLKQAVSPTPIVTPPGGTRTVVNPAATSTLR